MTVSIPTLQWPTELQEAGPAADRAIMLRGTATIGGAPHAVIALRVNPIDMTVDRRQEVSISAYAEFHWGRMLDDLSSYTDLDDGMLVALATGSYAIVVLPASYSADFP